MGHCLPMTALVQACCNLGCEWVREVPCETTVVTHMLGWDMTWEAKEEGVVKWTINS